MNDDRKEFLSNAIRNEAPEYIEALLVGCFIEDVNFMAYDLGCKLGEYMKEHEGEAIPIELIDDANEKMILINKFSDSKYEPVKPKSENAFLKWLEK